jgi:hypothetical protein
MISVVYKGRALPLAWRVRQVPKGHFPEDFHINLVELVMSVIPEGTEVVFLGDGEFDGIDLQEVMNDSGWFYACRTAKSTVATWEGIQFNLDLLGSSIKAGMLIELKEVQFTRNAYGPVMVMCCWAKDEAEPLYLVSNLSLAEEAIKYYQKRFRIETFFSDQKSRGFNIQKSHLEDPQRLSRLLIATCLAYIWLVYLGTLCKREGWQSIIHRKSRCDSSLFQLGFRLLGGCPRIMTANRLVRGRHVAFDPHWPQPSSRRHETALQRGWNLQKRYLIPRTALPCWLSSHSAPTHSAKS